MFSSFLYTDGKISVRESVLIARKKNVRKWHLIRHQNYRGTTEAPPRWPRFYRDHRDGVHTIAAIAGSMDARCCGPYRNALNAQMFQAIWRKLSQQLQEGRLDHVDYLVKVDLDTVFFPAHLRMLLHERVNAAPRRDCVSLRFSDAHWLPGPIEVMSCA